MPLFKLEDFDPNYQETFGEDDVKGLEVYAKGNEKVGSVADVLVDKEGHFRYLVISSGFGPLGKNILLPIGLSRIDYDARRVYVDELSKDRVETLPEYTERMTVDYDYEEQVRGAYRPQTATSASSVNYDSNTYNYEQDASLYNLNEQDHQVFKLYEERLIAGKNRVKTGEVTIGKRVESETTRVSVPIEKERIVIERVTPDDAGIVVTPGEHDFQEGEVARIEVYEETPDIHKEAFVREEVKITKVVDQETVESEQQVRREELDVKTENQTIANSGTQLKNDQI